MEINAFVVMTNNLNWVEPVTVYYDGTITSEKHDLLYDPKKEDL